MRLSALQKHILRESYMSDKARIARRMFYRFYKTATPTRIMVETLTKSLERLIDKGLMTGYGRRTPEKWFMVEVALTPRGRKTAKTLFGQQQKLPLK